jgi:hypothetical protein
LDERRPHREALGPGKYFFVVFQPSGQSNPNDGSDNLLSYDVGGDPYTNRSFIINNDLTITYSGNHDKTGLMIRLGLNPDGAGPNLDDWYETTPNSGGEYHLGICRLARRHDAARAQGLQVRRVQARPGAAPVCDEQHPELCPGCDEQHPELCPSANAAERTPTARAAPWARS